MTEARTCQTLRESELAKDLAYILLRLPIFVLVEEAALSLLEAFDEADETGSEGL